MNDFLAYLQTLYPLSPDLIKHLKETLKTKTAIKKSFLLNEGQVSQYIFFIKSGLVRCYYIKSGEEISCWFMSEGDFIISVESFFYQIKSNQNVQALEDTELIYISYSDLQLIYRRYPEFNFIGRILTEKYYALSEQRLYSIRMQRAQERYEIMEQNFPGIIQRVPFNMIASYLGITKETLSRIRSRRHIVDKFDKSSKERN